MRRITIKQAVEFAIGLEKNGIKFYKECGENSKKDEARNLFFFLAAEEGKHLEVLSRMFSGVGRYDTPSVEGKRAQMLLDAYAKAFLPGQALADDKSLKKMDAVGAIDFGIKTELNGIDYYNQLRKIVAEEHAGLIDNIIKEEREHYRKFVNFKKSLQQKNE